MNLSLIQLRKELHQYPGISGKEKETAGRIIRELKKCNPDDIMREVGGTGVIATFLSKKKPSRKAILFRAELDAISVNEETGLEYESQYAEAMHGCGHDGHMAILIGLARTLESRPPEGVDVYLLFQPAEETGKGAGMMLEDNRLKQLQIDLGFALHNLPGFEENAVYIRSGPFACASAGLEITLKGKSSHAAYPEQGINPAMVLSGLLQNVEQGMKAFLSEDDSNQLAVTYIKMGEPAYGISPGEAKIGFTVRSATDEGLNTGLGKLEQIVEDQQKNFKGTIQNRRVEPFAATINHESGADIVKQVAETLELPVHIMEKPFLWSEDFGEFRSKFPITIFGLGAGEEVSPLHSETYDFNDNLIKTGVDIFRGIVDSYIS